MDCATFIREAGKRAMRTKSVRAALAAIALAATGTTNAVTVVATLGD
jgi:hypothetical protein